MIKSTRMNQYVSLTVLKKLSSIVASRIASSEFFWTIIRTFFLAYMINELKLKIYLVISIIWDYSFLMIFFFWTALLANNKKFIWNKQFLTHRIESNHYKILKLLLLISNKKKPRFTTNEEQSIDKYIHTYTYANVHLLYIDLWYKTTHQNLPYVFNHTSVYPKYTIIHFSFNSWQLFRWNGRKNWQKWDKINWSKG